ncbi:lytic transglycosylase domain-containing protein [Rhizobium halophytocola]|uniref:Soluble lytic murein transglycosylase-like protein n=1 Tax=Rhizobium halophytocola TaxID=735519 RepID=A0ABS4E347_9HYPH|nr:lytic transglycosylase domain-containing protein [Rhizobium halophytocola]MBP1852352.1 soluble lytic murein transglycosylase-like protein [Rhizobium halophytocola]
MANRVAFIVGVCGLGAAMAGLSGCTSGMEEAARQELKARPTAGQSSDDMRAAALALQPADDGGAEGPAPTVPGTTTLVPLPTFKVAVLSSPDATPTADQAEAVMVARQTAALQAPAMPTNPNPDALPDVANASLAMEDDEVAVPPQPAIAPSVIPSPRPGTALAYADTRASGSLAALNSDYDTSAPAADLPTTSGPTVINGLIKKYSVAYQVPESLVHRVVHRESRYNPAAFNHGHYGLMQIKYATAKSMGYSGPASGLFDAENNLKYAIKYLRGAWLVADKDADDAVRYYARGYYYDAKRRGMLSVFR